MFLLAEPGYDPLCGAKLFVQNAQTMRPRPGLYQGLIPGTGVKCEPCLQPSGILDEYRCYCNCFQFDQPSLFTGIGGPGSSCSNLRTEAAAKTVLLIGECPTVGRDCSRYGTICQDFTGDPPDGGCIWSYEVVTTEFHYQTFQLACPVVPHVPQGLAGLYISYANGNAFTTIWFIELNYVCTNFTASGGTFTLDTQTTVVQTPCTTGPSWTIPSTIEVTGVQCT